MIVFLYINVIVNIKEFNKIIKNINYWFFYSMFNNECFFYKAKQLKEEK